MRFMLSTALLGALALSACTSGEEQPAVGNDVVADDTIEATETAGVTDANSATVEQLSAMDGISPELAAAIVAGQPYEDAVAFNTVLMATLDETQAAAVRETLFVPVNLNTASEDAIKLIPGMTPKMVHEFEEYRPYADMAEFDREIGKYVDEAEVARFRQYVTL